MALPKGNIPWNKGKRTGPLSGEHRKHLSQSKSGPKHWNYGKQTSLISRRKMSQSHLGLLAGSRHPAWKGGISKIDKSCRHMPEYRQWRSDVFQRDMWTCQGCMARGCYLTAHHIKGFSLILKENGIATIESARDCLELWDLDNGVTLCESCHALTDNYKGRAHSLDI